MEILLWLVPPAVVTVLAMLWVSWLGRAGRGEVDREEAVRRLARAMGKEHPVVGQPRPAPVRDRSTGIAVRPSATRPSRPARPPPIRRARWAARTSTRAGRPVARPDFCRVRGLPA